jgi:hypothetical protein
MTLSLSKLTRPKNFWVLLAALLQLAGAPGALAALGDPSYVETVPSAGSFPLIQQGTATPLLVDAHEHSGVLRAASALRADLARVGGQLPPLSIGANAAGPNLILIGTLGRNARLEALRQSGKLNVDRLAGKWEASLTQVVPEPWPGVSTALVIAGSDKRGTIYGIYELSQQVGVSPWYWWADVPVRQQPTLFVKAGPHVLGPPAVRYRGIFLNDESPALTRWVRRQFGDYNHRFYTNVFELLLRLKANYLWPAMWNNCFNDDDPLNPQLADDYGIVMGTSHVEPMLRADKEWSRLGHSHEQWNYERHPEWLRAFWEQSIERNRRFESVITIGMRGKVDTPMAASANIALLERIITDQRAILARHFGSQPPAVPQLWALYKEVQDYYEQGMRVPDDVTLLWCDDNWGNLRRLPTSKEQPRSGGAGIYYHLDYVGGPRSYKWLNTVPATRLWEQMNLAFHHQANRIWIVNVGDLKPMEFPMELFLTLAWDASRWSKERIPEFTRRWAEREFGAAHASAIAELLTRYTKFNGRRKPELLEPATFSLLHYREAETAMAEWNALVTEAERVNLLLPHDARDAFAQLVLHPIRACANLNELYVTVAQNRLHATQRRASANELARKARALFQADARFTAQYHALAGGKWKHLMDQPHIGYTSWKEPMTNVMPHVQEVDVPIGARLGITVEGSASVWPGASGQPALEFDRFNQPRRFIELFNYGYSRCAYQASASAPWLQLSHQSGSFAEEQRLWVTLDWTAVPKGDARGTLTVSGPGVAEVTIEVRAFNPIQSPPASWTGFVEADGVVSMEAEHFTRNVSAGDVRWERIPDDGRTLSSMTLVPVTAASVAPPRDSPCLEYGMFLFTSGATEVELLLAPILNHQPGRAIRLGVSFDEEAPRVLTVVPADYSVDNGNKDWEEMVQNAVRKVRFRQPLEKPGEHTLKIWMVDPGIVLQKLVVNTGGLKPSYLGPPESWRQTAAAPGPTPLRPPPLTDNTKPATNRTE